MREGEQGCGAIRSACIARFGEQLFERPEHQGQRRAELVADIREEYSLDAIDFRERFGALAFRFIGIRIGDRGRDLGGREVEEAAVLFVELQPRADAGDQEPVELKRQMRAQRQGDGAARRIWPGTARYFGELRAE